VKTRHLAASLLLAWIGSSCGTSETDEPLSAVLITLDTTRADALTCYGGRPGITPALDALAAESVRYERAWTVAPLTLPAHASMLTGLYPPRHTLRINGERALPPAAITLAEEAHEAGMQTAAFIASVVLDEAFGLDQGFDVYDSPRHHLQQTTTYYTDRSAGEVVARASEWLRNRDRGRRFFLWVHVWDPHGPWNPPPEYLRLAPDHPYLGDVAVADRGVGELLDTLRNDEAGDETLILVVGDHGEAFWEHGEFSHSAYCYETTMRVPMLLRYPDGYRAGETSDETVSVTDVRPTLAEAMHLPLRDDVDGRSLFRRGVPADRGVYFESYYGYLAYEWSPLTGWIDERGKYLHSSEPQLFDLRADPGETRNLVRERPEEVERYRRAIANVASRPPLALSREGSIDAGVREEVGKLGYASTRASNPADLPGPLADTKLPSPASRVEERRRLLDALDHFNAGRWAEAETIHRTVLADNPRNHHAHERLGICLIRQSRHLEAIPPLREALASGRGTASAAVNLGMCLRVAKRYDEAIRWFETALEIDGSRVSAVRHLMDLYGQRGDSERVEEYTKRFVELTGDNASQ